MDNDVTICLCQTRVAVRMMMTTNAWLDLSRGGFMTISPGKESKVVGVRCEARSTRFKAYASKNLAEMLSRIPDKVREMSDNTTNEDK